MPDPNAAPTNGGSRLRANPSWGVGGNYTPGESQQWWDGSSWVKAPRETKIENGKTYQFNYDTGEYKEAPAGTGSFHAAW